MKTALSMHILSNTGAYGNHGPGVLFHGVGESAAQCHPRALEEAGLPYKTRLLELGDQDKSLSGQSGHGVSRTAEAVLLDANSRLHRGLCRSFDRS
jgi:hypothetical protein